MDNNSTDNLLVNALLKEKKSDRVWRNVRFFVWVFLALIYALLIFSCTSSKNSKPADANSNKPYVSLIRLNGEIAAGRSFSSEKVVPELIRAFRDKHARGVVIVINSPGGSPVQASIIHDKIMQLKKQYKKRVIVIGQDALASGAYLVATAADTIYVHNDTLTGSIGVIMSGFGFSDAIQKIGVTRRVFTAGTNKDRLDPFKPLNPADAAKVHKLLNEVHQHFIDDVLQGRGNKLQGDREELFSGDFWTGSTAVKLGIADKVGNTWDVLKNEFGVTHYRNYSKKPTLLQMLVSGAETELHLALSQKSNSQLKAELP
ncbi:MAG: S49 family peptidase [Coxiellaceae bacterium]|nr:S49 family peptidase [Coxiellaceae bacterium]